MGALFDFLDLVKAKITARLRIKAQKDLAAGQAILDQAEKEAREMELAGKTVPDSTPKPNGDGR